MRPKGKSVVKIKYETLSDAYDRLKADNTKLSSQISKLQEDFDNLARVKVYQLLDVLRDKIHTLESTDYPQGDTIRCSKCGKMECGGR
jgi:cell division protein FtsB